MPIHICQACGTSYADAPSAPERCPICMDERQYVPRRGQAWTTAAELARQHANTWRLIEPGLFEIHTKPEFAIGQRALLIRTPGGNYLWDCISLIDEATVEIVKGLGGLAASPSPTRITIRAARTGPRRSAARCTSTRPTANG